MRVGVEPWVGPEVVCPPLWWCCVQGSCAVPCFCSLYFVAGGDVCPGVSISQRKAGNNAPSRGLFICFLKFSSEKVGFTQQGTLN